MSFRAMTLLALLPALVVRGSSVDYVGDTSVAGDESCALQLGRKSGQSLSQCVDTDPNCALYAKEGYCTGEQSANVRAECKMSCGLCACVDTDPNCAYYAKEGYCTGSESANVREKCKYSCGLCDNCPAQRPEANSPCDGSASGCEYDFVQCPDGKSIALSVASCTGGSWTILKANVICPDLSTQCVDTDPNCAYYAKEGYCTGEESANVRAECKKSCGLCACVDTDPNCALYAREGYCTGDQSANVRADCKMSCGLCDS